MTKKLKNKKLRHNEYYDMQDIYDGLYQKSKDGGKCIGTSKTMPGVKRMVQTI